MLATLDIVDLAQGGEGVARLDGRAVFVPFAAPGDRVAAEVPEGTGPAHAAFVELLSPGPARVAAPCPHFGAAGPAAPERGCGGCEWLHLAYAAQLRQKERALAETLRRIGGLEPGSYEALPIAPSPSPLRYRCRAKFHFDRRGGRLVFFRRRSHEVVPIGECHLLQAELDALRGEMGPALVRARLDAREVTLEWSRHQGRGAAHLVLSSSARSAERRAEGLLAALPALAGVVLQADGAPPLVVGDPVLRHARRPGDAAGGVQRSRPDAFQQANREANALLVERALSLLRPEGEDVLELFCGAGNFTAPLAVTARSVHAVEGQGPALELARADLAELAGARARFFAGEALALARALVRERGPSTPRFGAALLDPPRDGARAVGPILRDLGVARAVYVSCDPATLARDLKACRQAGYRVEAVQPVDMFPQTHHLEAVALLVR